MSQRAQDLAAAMASCRIELPTQQTVQLEQYCRLLWQWNTKINLTRHTNYQKFVARDLVDSLAIGKQLDSGETVLDVGSGGGVPGVVLAVVRSDLDLTLCESVGKKARALVDIVQSMDLNTPVVHSRAEELLKKRRFNTLLIRAVARLNRLLGWFGPHCDAFDRLLLLKGRSWIQERAEARHQGLLHGLALRRLMTYTTPDTGAENVMLQICPEAKLLGEKTCRLTKLQ